tara:strand:- start:156 stop:590 length:435 start_codon:yes stop_codon:yes gene_type:complete
MSFCDICGKEDSLVRTKIDSVEVDVCSDCSKYGVALKEEIKEVERVVKPVNEILYVIVEDCGEIIKRAREKMGLKQETLADKISERESMIHKIENGQIEPDLGLAGKIERFLNVVLIEKYEDSGEKKLIGDDKAFTIGDLIDKK